MATEAAAAEATAALAAVNTQLKAAKAETSALKTENANLKQQVTTATSEVTALKQQKDQLTTEKAGVQKELDAAKQQVGTANAEVTALKQERDTLTKDKASVQTELDAAKKQVNTANAEVTSLKQEKNKLSQEKAGVQTELNTFKTQVTAAQNQVKELNGKLDTQTKVQTDLQKQLTAIKQQVDSTKAESEQIKKDKTQIQQQLAAAQDKVKTAEAHAKQQGEKQERQQRELHEMQEKVVASENKVAVLETETETVKLEKNELETTIDDLRKQLDAKVQSAQSDMIKLTRQYGEYKQEAEEQIARYEMQLKQYAAEDAALRIELQNAKQVREPPMHLSSCLSLHDDLTHDGPDDQSAYWAQTTEIKWTENEMKRLREEIFKEKYNSRGERVQFKILVFGPTGAGKSTLCNGLRSALRFDKHVSRFHQVGSRDSTYTLGFHPAQYEDMWIVDMCGIFETKQITDDKIKQILSGNVSFLSKITPNLDIVEQQADMPPPGANDLSCVLVVLRAGMELSPEIKRQMNNIWQLAGEGVISFRLVLTFIDQIDPELSNPSMLKNVLTSEKVQNTVKQMSKETGVPPTAISVVRSYVQETETDLNTNILLMHVLEKVIHDAMEQIEKKIHEERLRESYKQKSRNPWCNCVLQ